MEAVKIEELIPHDSEFTLSKTGKTYRLRRFDLADEAWMKTKYGERVFDIFNDIRMMEICEIVFHQMFPNDQEEFAAKDVKFIDESTGERGTMRIGGGPLLQHFITGFKEKLGIYNALNETLGLSRPVIEKLEASVEKEIVAQKKRAQLTGVTSSTRSRVTTGTRSRKSER